LPKYNFYIKVSATESEEPYSGITIYTPLKKDNQLIEKLIESSRKNWAIKYVRPEVPKTTNSHVKQTENKEEVATVQGGVPNTPESEIDAENYHHA
jgi:hypothetical protein